MALPSRTAEGLFLNYANELHFVDFEMVLLTDGLLDV